MNAATAEIERIVREVLAALDVAPASATPDAECRDSVAACPKPESVPLASQGSATQDALSVASVGDLVVTSRVVTMNDVLGRLDGARRLVVSPQAIVTPAVRDDLLRRGIALHVAEAMNPPAAAVRLALVLSGADFDPTSLSAALTREGFRVEAMASDCLIAAAEQAAEEAAKPETLGVLLTRHTAAALCLANRLPGVRAVTAADAPSAAAAAASVGANLLVANPQAGTFFQFKQMITEFGRGGVRPCPAVFRKQLG